MPACVLDCARTITVLTARSHALHTPQAGGDFWLQAAKDNCAAFLQTLQDAKTSLDNEV
jgi:hypothetical protein